MRGSGRRDEGDSRSGARRGSSSIRHPFEARTGPLGWLSATSIVALCAMTLAWTRPTLALEIRIEGPDREAVPDAVVALYPLDGDSTGSATPVDRPVAVMDQVDLAFVPHVLAIRTGSIVEFPNSDQVRHSIYSFSAARSFEIKLYKGFEAPPLEFDQPGLVVLGCNIHDHMIGFVYVLDTTHSGVSDDTGRVEIADPPPGRYRLELRHPRLDDGLVVERVVDLPDAAPTSIALERTPPPRPTRPEEDEDPLQSLFEGGP